jgi:hypothetical protein
MAGRKRSGSAAYCGSSGGSSSVVVSLVPDEVADVPVEPEVELPPVPVAPPVVAVEPP